MDEDRVINLTMPFPPSTNTYWRHIGIDKTVISKEGRAYQNRVYLFTMMQRKAIADRPLKRRLELVLSFYPADRVNRDIDNYEKALFDAMVKAGILVNDGQIKRVEKEMFAPPASEKRDEGTVEIVIRECAFKEWDVIPKPLREIMVDTPKKGG